MAAGSSGGTAENIPAFQCWDGVGGPAESRQGRKSGDHAKIEQHAAPRGWGHGRTRPILTDDLNERRVKEGGRAIAPAEAGDDAAVGEGQVPRYWGYGVGWRAVSVLSGEFGW